MKTTVLLFALVLSAIADPTSKPLLTTQEVTICETVFLRQFSNTMSHANTNALYVLSVKGQNPDDAVMKRLAGHQPPLRKLSEVSPERKHLTTTLAILEIKWTDATHVRVDGRCDEPGHNIATDTYFLEERGGKWVITKQEKGMRAGG